MLRTVLRISVTESYERGKLVHKEERIEKGEAWEDFVAMLSFARCRR
jgi:hypothetical protein